MPDYLSILADDVKQPFTPNRFSISRQPVFVATVQSDRIGNYPSCLDMLIKLPAAEAEIPAPYCDDLVIQSLVSSAFSFEQNLLPTWFDSHYVYLTFDQRMLCAGKTHRNAGWHFDGMQGSRYPVKLNACHQYVYSSHCPTEFSAHPTSASNLDELTHNWYEALARQIPVTAPIIRPAIDELWCMSAYQLHRSPVINQNEVDLRTFLRIDISLKQQDRLGNTHNPCLPAPWSYVPRALPEGLARPISDAGWPPQLWP